MIRIVRLSGTGVKKVVATAYYRLPENEGAAAKTNMRRLSVDDFSRHLSAGAIARVRLQQSPFRFKSTFALSVAPMPDREITFYLKGPPESWCRIQSSWFPLYVAIDRDFVPNIFLGKAGDTRKASRSGLSLLGARPSL